MGHALGRRGLAQTGAGRHTQTLATAGKRKDATAGARGRRQANAGRRKQTQTNEAHVGKPMQTQTTDVLHNTLPYTWALHSGPNATLPTSPDNRMEEGSRNL
eukprot:11197303-Lingulodinium_polyedra.AAC.1